MKFRDDFLFYIEELNIKQMKVKIEVIWSLKEAAIKIKKLDIIVRIIKDERNFEAETKQNRLVIDQSNQIL
jgi:hypothetical protein